MNDKVSIILPCYNGQKTIKRAIDGVINQTYRPIELIIINDGSTDDSLRIIEETIEKSNDAYLTIACITQLNQGLGSAINTGLQHVSGTYLAWVDSDDELLPQAIEKKVHFLETHADYGSVSTNAYLAEDRDWQHPLGLLVTDSSIQMKEWQFEYMLLGQSIFCAGCHLVRMDVFEKANQGRNIYPAKHGQNWQLLLPVYYCAKHGYIDEPLYKYRVNADNMTSELENLPATKIYSRRKEYLKIVKYTLAHINGMKKHEMLKNWKKYKKYIYSCNMATAADRKHISGYVYWRIKVMFLEGYKRSDIKKSFLFRELSNKNK